MRASRKLSLALALAGIVATLAVYRAAAGAPSLAVDRTTHDFGAVPQGQVLRHRFVLANRGRGILRFGKIEAACGCTWTELPATQLRPGEETTLDIAVVTDVDTGPVQRYISVETSDVQQRTLVLTVSAIIEPEFRLSEKVLDFGQSAAKDEPSRLVEIQRMRGGSRVVAAASTDPGVSVRLLPSVRPDRFRLLAVRRAPGKDGHHWGNVIVETTSPAKPQLRIPVRGTVVSPVP